MPCQEQERKNQTTKLERRDFLMGGISLLAGTSAIETYRLVPIPSLDLPGERQFVSLLKKVSLPLNGTKLNKIVAVTSGIIPILYYYIKCSRYLDSEIKEDIMGLE